MGTLERKEPHMQIGSVLRTADYTRVSNKEVFRCTRLLNSALASSRIYNASFVCSCGWPRGHRTEQQGLQQLGLSCKCLYEPELHSSHSTCMFQPGHECDFEERMRVWVGATIHKDMDQDTRWCILSGVSCTDVIPHKLHALKTR